MASSGFPAYVHHQMKNEQISQVEKPTGAPLQRWSKPAAPRLPVVRILIAAVAILTQVMILGSIGQTIIVPNPGNPSAQTQPSSPSLLAAQGRQHPSYLVFASHFALPAIIVVGATTLEVDGKMKIDVSRLDQLTTQQKESLAGQLEIPIGVVDNLLASFSGPAPTDAAQLAGRLRVAVTDYKYLLERWNRYLPPAGRENVKADALLALQAGELDKAWGLYAGLPKPAPPTGFQIVGGN